MMIRNDSNNYISNNIIVSLRFFLLSTCVE